jgi:hypothetical protein
MAGLPLHLTLARSFAETGTHYRVLAHRLDQEASATKAADHEVGSIELNRRIELVGGEAFAISQRGNWLAPTHVLLPAANPTRDEPPLAQSRRERVGWWWHSVIIAEPTGDRRFLLRRRGVFGSPANANLVAQVPNSAPLDLAKLPIVLRVEKVGAWRQRLEARWLDVDSLSLPIVLFVLNLLADQDRRAAIAASAGAAGV